MSKIKLTGHASGSGVLTIAAPNTDTDRTITLPDVTGTLLDSGSDLPAANLTGSVAAARIASNTIDSAHITAGAIDDAHLATGISASKLTGALPAISGANLTGVGVAGISSSADATAISIDSSERVGIGAATSPNTLMHIKAASGSVLRVEETSGSYIDIEAGGSTGHIKSKSGHDITFSPGGNNHLQLYSSGRAKSQFTIAAWVNFNGTGTVAIRDSLNVSSMGDWGTGQYGIYFTSGFANSNYAYASMAQDSRIVSVERDNGKPDGGRLDVSCERSWDAALTDNETLSVLVIGDQS